MKKSFIRVVEGKRVLFITTKNIDYIRNVQEIQILESKARSVKKVYSNRKNYVGRLIEIWFKLFCCKNWEFECVFIGFAPQLIFPFFHKFRKRQIIIDFFISVYDTFINDRKKFSQQSIIAALCHKLDIYTINKADIVIADTKADRDYFISTFHGNAEKFEVLYLEADRAVYYPRKREKKQCQDKFIVLYFGSILPLQGIDVLFNAVRLLKERKDILVQIIGPVPEKYDKPVQENVQYIEWLSQEKLAQYIAEADLCLAGHFNAGIDKAKRTIPGKAYIYEAMNMPMILGDNPANREFFREDLRHSFVEMGNPQKLAELILQKQQVAFQRRNCNEHYCCDNMLSS